MDYLLGVIYLLFSVHICNAQIQSDDVDLWRIWGLKYLKRYANESEEMKRKEIWKKNVEIIKEHNAKFYVKQETYRMSLNEYSDLTWTEFQQMFLSKPTRSQQTGQTHSMKEDILNSDDMPENLDYREQGIVTSVKHQGNCNSAWAFAAIGAVEGQMRTYTTTTESLSAQQLLDCSKEYGTKGCDGGPPYAAFAYMSKQGIEKDTSYPYTEHVSKCQHNPSKSVVQVTDLIKPKVGNESSLQTLLFKLGPAAIEICVVDSFRHYKEGIYHSDHCSSTELNHPMLLIGYGIDNGNKYWLLKNSWGVEWGEKGYIKILRNQDNLCGIASRAFIPLC